MGQAGLTVRPGGTAPRLRGISRAAVQLEPLGWESLKQQTSQHKGMFHCFFWLSGFLFSKELFQHLWGRGLACTEPGPRADPCPGGKLCCLASGRGRCCKRSAATFARDLQQECWRLGFFRFFFLSLGEFCPICCLRDDNNQYFTETTEVAKVGERVQLATLLAEGLSLGNDRDTLRFWLGGEGLASAPCPLAHSWIRGEWSSCSYCG